ncbi:hypothetical protein [Methylacidiphilum caldifontis]|uniref:Uncharacterized protein n=1 Tax=Methylacidiphilum caldifontis TaxID=2795386 RepID=A0A4Y8PGG4_9BACT|nr:hypothetical protein [Methylacidiphilum caldifontis]TFE71320.1 hypothetical protein A7Q10_04935 [Methylacidiphilum caldifontis]
MGKKKDVSRAFVAMRHCGRLKNHGVQKKAFHSAFASCCNRGTVRFIFWIKHENRGKVLFFLGPRQWDPGRVSSATRE